MLDEATASVDLETDELIQKTLRTQLDGVTIAHCLDTIMHCDRVVVADGKVAEHGPPLELRDQAGVVTSCGPAVSRPRWTCFRQ